MWEMRTWDVVTQLYMRKNIHSFVWYESFKFFKLKYVSELTGKICISNQNYFKVRKYCKIHFLIRKEIIFLALSNAIRMHLFVN